MQHTVNGSSEREMDTGGSGATGGIQQSQVREIYIPSSDGDGGTGENEGNDEVAGGGVVTISTLTTPSAVRDLIPTVWFQKSRSTGKEVFYRPPYSLRFHVFHYHVSNQTESL